MQKINIMGIRSSVILNRFKTDWLVMEEITEEQEKQIEARKKCYDDGFYVTKNNIKVSDKDIFLYGEIDVTAHDDLELLRDAEIITQNVNQAANIPSNFCYETGFVYPNKDGIIKTYDTWNKIAWFTFNHLLLGKPKRVIIYRISKFYVPRNRGTRYSNS